VENKAVKKILKRPMESFVEELENDVIGDTLNHIRAEILIQE